MLSWLFKKRGPSVSPTASAPTTPASAEARAQATQAAQAEQARQLESLRARLQAAQGDEQALLQLAKEASVLEIQLAAVEALSSEAVLKQAERELRQHNSRVHRAAKRRWQERVAQREADTQAQALIDTAQALARETVLPANRLVALDRDWQALDAQRLSAAHREQFEALRDTLNAQLHEQAALAQRLAQEAQVAAARAAEEQARAAAQAAAPAPAPAAMPAETAARGQAANAAPGPEAEPSATATDEAHTPAVPSDVTTAADTSTSTPTSTPTAARAPRPSASAAQWQAFDAALAPVEAALATGELTGLQALWETLHQAVEALAGASFNDTRRQRWQAVQAERARLRDWQQWGGSLALDGLVHEAEALAQLTAAASAPPAEGERPEERPSLQIKAHGEQIQRLRTRWKEVTRQGHASSQALWPRFDAALQAAYAPVAAHLAALKAAREDNLNARQALLAGLEAWPDLPESANADEASAHWKERARALGDFHQAWRQLGPVEHTVPARARQALHERLTQTLERVEAPLQAARAAAEKERSQLIARAEALVQELSRPHAARDSVARVRDLQAQWQQQARALPLARAVENALWARFKAATDAVFAQREAAHQARDAEVAALVAERETLLAALDELLARSQAAAPGEARALQHELQEIARNWRHAPALPRGAATHELDARYRQAHETAEHRLAQLAQAAWQSQCTQLAQQLAAPGATGDALSGELPGAWTQALAARGATPALPSDAIDEHLLTLEMRLDVPASPEWQERRRAMKLRAMKEALEGRAASPQGPVHDGLRFASLLSQAALDPVQTERLQALVQALSNAQPGTLTHSHPVSPR